MCSGPNRTLVVAVIYVPALIVPILTVISASFMYLHATNSGLDAWKGGGGTSWWRGLRPYHRWFFLLAGSFFPKKPSKHMYY